MTSPLSEKRIAVIGAGNMAEAMIRGLLKANVCQPHQITATAPRTERLKLLVKTYGIHTSTHNGEAVAQADVVILSVKPQIMHGVVQEIAPSVQPHALVLSVAAGVSLHAIESRLPAGSHVCRAMPNTPARIGAGATAYARGSHATDDDMACAQAIFSAVGYATEVDETLLNAVTGLSGSGPAYVFLIIDALADAGVKVGLPRYKALTLAAQTVFGSAQLLIETGEHPGVLKDNVTSPGGTAIAGLHTLEEGGLRTTLINAVVAATKRAEELGQHHGAAKKEKIRHTRQ